MVSVGISILAGQNKLPLSHKRITGRCGLQCSDKIQFRLLRGADLTQPSHIAVDHIGHELIKPCSRSQHGKGHIKGTRLKGYTPKSLGKTDRGISPRNNDSLRLGFGCRKTHALPKPPQRIHGYAIDFYIRKHELPLLSYNARRSFSFCVLPSLPSMMGTSLPTSVPSSR